MKDFFSIKGRISRIDYLKIYLSIFFFEVINVLYCFPKENIRYMITILVVSYLLLVLTIPITIRRLHDTNRSGKYIILDFLSLGVRLAPLFGYVNIMLFFIGTVTEIAFLILIFKKGTLENNKYGAPEPIHNNIFDGINVFTYIILLLTLISFILGIII